MGLIKTYSLKWMQVRNADNNACDECKEKHNRIVEVKNILQIIFPLASFHLYCRCVLEHIDKKTAGTIDEKGTNGGDYWIVKYGKLPERYITKLEAKALGYTRSQNNLHKVAPTRVFGGTIFSNRDKVMPEAPGRIWYEADINSTSQKRGLERIVYSNDGLVFYTPDHYRTFCEVVEP